jgi:hypothetical protein
VVGIVIGLVGRKVGTLTWVAPTVARVAGWVVVAATGRAETGATLVDGVVVVATGLAETGATGLTVTCGITTEDEATLPAPCAACTAEPAGGSLWDALDPETAAAAPME